jgi:hypothetical protein
VNKVGTIFSFQTEYAEAGKYLVTQYTTIIFHARILQTLLWSYLPPPFPHTPYLLLIFLILVFQLPLFQFPTLPRLKSVEITSNTLLRPFLQSLGSSLCFFQSRWASTSASSDGYEAVFVGNASLAGEELGSSCFEFGEMCKVGVYFLLKR